MSKGTVHAIISNKRPPRQKPAPDGRRDRRQQAATKRAVADAAYTETLPSTIVAPPVPDHTGDIYNQSEQAPFAHTQTSNAWKRNRNTTKKL